jgi:DNA-binding transcriptional LysR family regulator
LLLVFDALMAERSATRAGQRVGLSQPAVSNALGRLRQLFDDELFIKTPAGMAPTPRAQSPAGPLRIALSEIAEAMRPPAPFDLGRAERTFILGMNDYGEFTLLPSLVQLFRDIAPNLRLYAREGFICGRTTAQRSLYRNNINHGWAF